MMKRKLLAHLSVLAVVAAMPTGFAHAQDLVVWAENGTNIAQSGLIKKFEDANPGVTVKLTEYPWQVAHDKVVAALSGGDVPDVVLSEVQWVGEFAALGELAPLDDFKKAQGYKDEDFFPNAWSWFVEGDGKLYGTPAYQEARALYYRKDIFEAAGIKDTPKTLDELVEVGKKLTDGENHFGLADQTGDLDFHFFSWLLYAHGSDVYDESRTKCTLTDPKAVAALSFYKSLYDQNIIPKDPAKRVDTAHGFEEGYYAMAESGPWWLNLIHAEAPQIDGKWAAAPLPAGETQITFGNPLSWMVPAAAKNKEGAQAWIKMMLDPTNGVDWFLVSGQLPPAKAAYDDARIKGDPNIAALVGSAERGTNAVHGVPNGQAITLEIIKMISTVKDGTAQPADAAAAACSQIDQLLNG
jgi:ABC-type glycerol-3-phosphate transport system substrate-binding protein